MRRITSFAVIGLCLALSACPSYDRYGRISDERGLLEADRFAALGTEQAQAIAIGRALAAGYTGEGAGAPGRQVRQALVYAHTLPDVRRVVADSQVVMLTVTFQSGWRKAIVPIDDGVLADRTAGLPARH